jgi:hypothetical protein
MISANKLYKHDIEIGRTKHDKIHDWLLERKDGSYKTYQNAGGDKTFEEWEFENQTNWKNELGTTKTNYMNRETSWTAIGSGIGALAGVYFAYKGGKSIWLYVGYAIGLSIVGGIAGSTAAMVLPGGSKESDVIGLNQSY